jgi:hypothetical protein
VRPVGNDLAHVISTQETQHATDNHTSWTLNFAAFVPELRAIRGFKPDDSVPDASGCYGTVRIGELLRSDSEFWYEVGTDGILEMLGQPQPKHPLHPDYSPLKPTTVRRAITRDLEDLVIP